MFHSGTHSCQALDFTYTLKKGGTETSNYHLLILFIKKNRKMNNHTEQSAKASLEKKLDIRFVGKTIEHLRDGRGDVGHGSWGKIDYLTNHHQYRHVFVKEFKK